MNDKLKITSEISKIEDKNIYNSDIRSQSNQFIEFAKFAKSYQSNRKVEKAWEQWLQKKEYENGK